MEKGRVEFDDPTFRGTRKRFVELPQGKSGFFDLPKYDVCKHPQHKPPGHMVIPQGKGYRHVCPGCGNEQILIAPQITL